MFLCVILCIFVTPVGLFLVLPNVVAVRHFLWFCKGNDNTFITQVFIVEISTTRLHFLILTDLNAILTDEKTTLFLHVSVRPYPYLAMIERCLFA